MGLLADYGDKDIMYDGYEHHFCYGPYDDLVMRVPTNGKGVFGGKNVPKSEDKFYDYIQKAQDALSDIWYAANRHIVILKGYKVKRPYLFTLQEYTNRGWVFDMDASEREYFRNFTQEAETQDCMYDLGIDSEIWVEEDRSGDYFILHPWRRTKMLMAECVNDIDALPHIIQRDWAYFSIGRSRYSIYRLSLCAFVENADEYVAYPVMLDRVAEQDEEGEITKFSKTAAVEYALFDMKDYSQIVNPVVIDRIYFKILDCINKDTHLWKKL